ncbi:MAG: DNA-3-methyladenine glycosylase [Candidatus Microgenomates bacterium]|jgi:DNA-3-methyladenine glycosylase
MSQKIKRLNKEFFKRGAKEVAKDLLGKKLVRILPNRRRKEGIITETEAYVGILDKASHSFGGRRTKRNEVMYGEAGRVYVYFTYGMHWLLNFVVSKKDNPQAVLIRSLDMVTGPARLTKYLGIDKSFYGEDLTKSERIWVEATGNIVKKGDIKKLPRIGVNYAGSWKAKLLRFLYAEKK